MNDLSGFFLLIIRIGALISLYVFLGWGLYVLWKEFRHFSSNIDSLNIPPILLSTKSQFETLIEKRFTYPQAYIGRDPACEFYLENETVSSKHARLYFENNQWWVEDLGSSNGTLLNNTQLEIPTVLTNNDQIQCGQVLIEISLEN